MIKDIVDLIGRFVPDKKERDKLISEMEIQYQKTLEEAVKNDTKLRIAEIKSSGLSKHWRPISALIVFFTFFIRFPLYWILQIIVNMLELNVYLPELEQLPMEFYGLATAFVSIYALGRNNEKLK